MCKVPELCKECANRVFFKESNECWFYWIGKKECQSIGDST